MASKEEVKRAREILGLGESATISEIKKAYRDLSLRFHPDKCGEENTAECEKKFKDINEANEVLIKYCLNYPISFDREIGRGKLREKHMEEHMKRFYDGWWGELKDE